MVVRDEEAKNFEVMNNLEQQINRMRQDIEQREIMAKGLESNLQQISEFADRKQKDLDEATKSLHAENARKIVLDEDIFRLETEVADDEVQFESKIKELVKSQTDVIVLAEEEYVEKLDILDI